ncbi:hypothetical protein [Synechococcus sp. MIT S1220]|uniref:hypothetical protein n=1 Tax=Synechococcus sp. MIT S1220 TaxID=3082549 RepID=UPI0039AECD65
MSTSTFVHQVKTTRQEQTQTKKYTADYIFVVQLFDGRYVIGQANNPSKRICSINSGYNSAVPKPLQVNRIIGIKEQNNSRTLIDVVTKCAEHYGDDAVICV